MINKPVVLHPSELPVENPFDLRPVYANTFVVSSTPTDVTIHFHEVVVYHSPNGPKPKQELKALITLPLSIGLALVESLSKQLDTRIAAEQAMQRAQQGPMH